MSKTRIALAAIAFSLTGAAAFAQEAVPATWNDSYTPNTAVVTSGKTRAEVKAELQAARQSGELDRYDADSYVPTPVNRSFASRHRHRARGCCQGVRRRHPRPGQGRTASRPQERRAEPLRR